MSGSQDFNPPKLEPDDAPKWFVYPFFLLMLILSTAIVAALVAGVVLIWRAIL